MDEKCFGQGYSGRCGILGRGPCGGHEQCGFYKPRWLYDRGQREAYARLRQLPTDQQAYIADRYYGGLMPWKAYR